MVTHISDAVSSRFRISICVSKFLEKEYQFQFSSTYCQESNKDKMLKEILGHTISIGSMSKQKGKS